MLGDGFSKIDNSNIEGAGKKITVLTTQLRHFYFDEGGSHLDTFRAGPDRLNFVVFP